jgi:hypothetical protein
MIIICPEKSFKKKIDKWVRHKDFLILDSTQHYDEAMKQLGGRAECDELAPTPTLQKIILEPDSQESKIKIKHYKRYLEAWLDDESVNVRIHYMASCIYRQWKTAGEDLNIFLVMRTPLYFKLWEPLAKKINDDYGVELAVGINHKLDKSTIKEVLSRKHDREYYKTLKKHIKFMGKHLDLEPEEVMKMQGMDDFD